MLAQTIGEISTVAPILINSISGKTAAEVLKVEQAASFMRFRQPYPKTAV